MTLQDAAVNIDVRRGDAAAAVEDPRAAVGEAVTDPWELLASRNAWWWRLTRYRRLSEDPPDVHLHSRECRRARSEAVRFEYEPNGTVVNLAARICAQARHGQLLVSQRVHASVEEIDQA